MKTLKGKANIIMIISILLIIIFNTAVSNATEIKKNEVEYSYSISEYRYFKLGMNEAIMIASVGNGYDRRRADSTSPGDYINNPLMFSSDLPCDVDSTDIEFIKSSIKPYLTDKYYDDKIMDHVSNFDCPELKRKEFYFDFYSESVFMVISGWYGEFAHIIVFTEFDSKQTLVEKAQHFFNIPSIDIKNIEYDEYQHPYSDNIDYFYSYVDDKNKFKIFGYQVNQYLTGQARSDMGANFTVIDLTIYTE